ncbi:MAG: hypothetical protein L6R39_005179 [Caloplaca ligustica]|nr:MAG: hypothetical protein L6R39_005179 [Caloplaca ligustica]
MVPLSRGQLGKAGDRVGIAVNEVVVEELDEVEDRVLELEVDVTAEEGVMDVEEFGVIKLEEVEEVEEVVDVVDVGDVENVEEVEEVEVRSDIVLLATGVTELKKEDAEVVEFEKVLDRRFDERDVEDGIIDDELQELVNDVLVVIGLVDDVRQKLELVDVNRVLDLEEEVEVELGRGRNILGHLSAKYFQPVKRMPCLQATKPQSRIYRDGDSKKAITYVMQLLANGGEFQSNS